MSPRAHSRRRLFFICVTIAGVFASPARAKQRPGWQRGRVHIRQLATLLASPEGQRLMRYPLHVDPTLKPSEAFVKSPQLAKGDPSMRRQAAFPWRARVPEAHSGPISLSKLLPSFLPVMDDRGWIRRRDLRAHYGADTARYLDFLLAKGRNLSFDGLEWNALFPHASDRLMRGLISGQRVVPPMRAFSRLVRRYGKLRPMHAEFRNHILGNTVGLILGSGLVPAQTHIFGKSYSLDARAAAFLHLKGYQVEGSRFRDGTMGVEYLDLDGSVRSRVDDYAAGIPSDPTIAAEFDEEERICRRIDGALAKIPHPERIKKPMFMIGDDGGELLEVVAKHLQQPRLARYRHLFAGVEQTTKGLNRLRALPGGVPFHIVSVADAWSKDVYGSPMLGYAVARQTADELRALTRSREIFIPSDSSFAVSPGHWMSDENGHLLYEEVPDAKVIRRGWSLKGRTIRVGGVVLPKQVVVLGGGGKIGGAVLRGWKAAGFEVATFDPKGVPTPPPGVHVYRSEEEALRHAHLLISATGETTIDDWKMELLPDGAIIANGGSAGEFKLPKQSMSVPNPLRKVDRFIDKMGFVRFKGRMVPTGGAEPHVVWRTNGDKEILVVKGGGVVNFPNAIEHPRAGTLIPGRYIQLAIGNFYLGMKQAAEGGPAGIHTLSRKPQEAFVAEIEAELKARGESLLDPSW